MPAPTNIDFLSAIDLGVLPASVVQDVNDSGTTYTVYYRYTAVTGENEIHILGFGDLTVYRPVCSVYTGDPNAPDPWPPIQATAQNRAIQIPVVPGETYFFEFASIGNVSPAILTITAVTGPTDLRVVGDLLINDDTTGFPLAVINQTTGAPRQFIYPFPGGEQGDALTTGVTLWEDNAGALEYQLYDPQFTLITTITTFPWDTGPMIRAQLGSDLFYVGSVGSGATHSVIKTIDATGAIGGTSWTLPTAGLTALCANRDDTILYHAGQGGSVAAPIKRWDLVNDIALADLVAGVANHVITDILVLDDDTVLACYYKSTVTRACFVRHYSAAGATLATYTFSVGNIGSTSSRLAYAVDSLSFWIMYHLSTPIGVTHLQNILVSDGSVLSDLTSIDYEDGAYLAAETAMPLADFGASFSCPIVLLREAETPPPTATLTVTKFTDPPGETQTFDFETTGGLSPSTFTLGDGDSQIFPDIPPGTYGVQETPVEGWTTEIVVSNGDDPDAIVLADGDDVTVTVTNTAPPICPGLVEGEQQDGLPYVPPFINR